MPDNRQILLMLSVGRDIGTGDPNEGDANATVRGHGGMCIHFYAVICKCVYMHEHGGWCFGLRVSWLMSRCRTSLFMSTVTHLFSQSGSTWNPGSLISTAAEQACAYTHTHQPTGSSEMAVVRLHNTHGSETGIVHGIYVKALWRTTINRRTYLYNICSRINED